MQIAETINSAEQYVGRVDAVKMDRLKHTRRDNTVSLAKNATCVQIRLKGVVIRNTVVSRSIQNVSAKMIFVAVAVAVAVAVVAVVVGTKIATTPRRRNL
jgi:hypothetical protein